MTATCAGGAEGGSLQPIGRKRRQQVLKKRVTAANARTSPILPLHVGRAGYGFGTMVESLLTGPGALDAYLDGLRTI